MDWVAEARRLFVADKPRHFTDFRHCDECAEHDETLLAATLEEIGMDELGNPGWDPVCFCSAEGMKYYFPAFVRLSLETVSDEFYFSQLLFHLEADGRENRLLRKCTPAQRDFVAAFIAYMMASFPDEIEDAEATEDARRTCALWSTSK